MAEITAYTTSLNCQAEKSGSQSLSAFTNDTISFQEMFFSAQMTCNILASEPRHCATAMGRIFVSVLFS